MTARDAATIWRTMTMHIWQQDYPHGEATIEGTPDALLRLADALRAATQAMDGRGVKVDMIDGSGEHYDVEIRTRKAETLQKHATPAMCNPDGSRK